MAEMAQDGWIPQPLREGKYAAFPIHLSNSQEGYFSHQLRVLAVQSRRAEGKEGHHAT